MIGPNEVSNKAKIHNETTHDVKTGIEMGFWMTRLLKV